MQLSSRDPFLHTLLLIVAGINMFPGARIVGAEESVRRDGEPPAHASRGTISGTVSDDATGEPVSGAFVAIDRSGEDNEETRVDFPRSDPMMGVGLGMV